MSIIIVDDEYLRTLKIKYFDIDVFTDVITFNLSDNKKDLEAEIYISWDRVNDNAKKFEQQIENEIKRDQRKNRYRIIGNLRDCFFIGI